MTIETKKHNDAILDDALRAATEGVFSHYGVTLTLVEARPVLRIDSHDAVGVIGFNSPTARGTLVIATTTELVARTYPESAMRATPLRDRVRDWVGELSNVVLGRIKIALMRHGCTIGLSTPVAFTGERLRLGAVKRSRTRAFDFTSPEGGVRAWLEVEIEPGFKLTEVEDGVSPEVADGELLLF